MTKKDVRNISVSVSRVSPLMDVVCAVTWPVAGAAIAHYAVKTGSSRVSAGRHYGTMLTIWLLGAGMAIGSFLAV